MKVAVFLTIVVLSLGLMAYAQQPQFTINDLKIMLAERDITIELLNRQLVQAQQEIEKLKAELKPEQK